MAIDRAGRKAGVRERQRSATGAGLIRAMPRFCSEQRAVAVMEIGRLSEYLSLA